MKSLWNRESWDRVETKEYRVSEEYGESKKKQRNREVIRTAQEKNNWTRKENDHGEVEGSGHVFPKLFVSQILILINEPAHNR